VTPAPSTHRLQVLLPGPLWHKVKARSTETGRSVSDVVREALSDTFIPKEGER
jgi:hypothetical protein